MIKVIDLFAGGGGLSLGFEKAGFDLIAAYENWEPAITLYENNFDHPVRQLDLALPSAVKELEKDKADVIIGGPPCQDFSSAGKRDESLGRADLTISFANIVSTLKPKYFVMENVDRASKSYAMTRAISLFQKSGYGLTIRVLNAAYCGVPQNRKRLFIIGGLKERDSFLDHFVDANQAEKPMTVREYLGNSLSIENYYRHPRSYKRRGIFSIDEPSPTVRGVNRPLPKGYPGHPGDTAKISKSIRPLTTKERSLLQTYPEDFNLVGTKTNIEQIIGNSVPVNLAKHVGDSLMSYIRSCEASTNSKVAAG